LFSFRSPLSKGVLARKVHSRWIRIQKPTGLIDGK
jgi:hypothetical protein